MKKFHHSPAWIFKRIGFYGHNHKPFPEKQVCIITIIKTKIINKRFIHTNNHQAIGYYIEFPIFIPICRNIFMVYLQLIMGNLSPLLQFYY